MAEEILVNNAAGLKEKKQFYEALYSILYSPVDNNPANKHTSNSWWPPSQKACTLYSSSTGRCPPSN